MDEMTLTLNSPITDEQFDQIMDVNLENTERVLFNTKNGKQVEYVKRNKGKWIEAIDTGVEMLECSACESRIKKRNYADSVGTEGYNFCPYCGADMRGNQDVKR